MLFSLCLKPTQKAFTGWEGYPLYAHLNQVSELSGRKPKCSRSESLKLFPFSCVGTSPFIGVGVSLELALPFPGQGKYTLGGAGRALGLLVPTAWEQVCS
jgi:hypothetical protein